MFVITHDRTGTPLGVSSTMEGAIRLARRDAKLYTSALSVFQVPSERCHDLAEVVECGRRVYSIEGKEN